MNKFFDTSLTNEERLDWLMSEMTIDEKLRCMATEVPDIERLGIHGFNVGGEAAHGVEARNDQNTLGAPEPTTSFPQPIGMSASWDTELIKAAGEVTGIEARVLYHRHPDRGLSRWAPTVDLERDPRWGRTEEGYGEDPVLTGAMASAYIQGMQGDDPEHLRIAATLKHFYGNNTEDGRVWKSSSIDPRNRYELYFEPFRRAIEDGHAEAMMTAYNRINGVPGMLNHEVRDKAKGQFGLKHAVCDGGAMDLVNRMHHYFGLDAETFAEALKAGIDAMSDRPEQVEKAAREAYELHLISDSDIDEALKNMFRTKLRLGIYDNKNVNPYDNVTEADIDSEHNRAVCHELSREAVVLLKNEGGFLPLSGAAASDKIALIGPLADNWYQDWYGGKAPYTRTLRDGIRQELGHDVTFADGQDRVVFRSGDKGIAVSGSGRLILSDKPDMFIKNDWGGGSYTFRCERTGKYMTSRDKRGDEHTSGGNVISADKDDTCDWFVMEIFHLQQSSDGHVGLSDRFGRPVYAADGGYLEALQDAVPQEFIMDFAENGLQKACDAARGKDAVILALGCNPMVNSKEEVDRKSIELPPAQQELLEKVYAVNKNIVLVLLSNYPYAVSMAKEKVPAVIWSATGSQDMGTAMAEALFGSFSPAGRLNMTWYESTGQLPDINDYDIIKGRRTYRYFDGPVLYPFGHGLTYTSFAYCNMKQTVVGGADLFVSFEVRNTGSAISDEVAEVYAAAPASRVRKPQKQLIAFRRLKGIAPGEVRNVQFKIPVKELRFFDTVSGNFMVEEGRYSILAGPSSADIRLNGDADIPGAKTGTREISRKIPAEYYDDYDNIYLTEGQFGFPAAAAADSTAGSRLIYRDCLIQENAETLMLHMKCADSCSVQVLLDGICVGNWNGDTKTWRSYDGLMLKDADRETSEQELECEGSLFMDIPVKLENAAKYAGKRADLTIVFRGDFRFCWFCMKEGEKNV